MKIRLVPGADTDEVTIKVSGSCESPDASHLRDVVDQVLDSGFRAIVLELSEVTYLSTHCGASLTGARRSAKDYGTELLLRDLSPACQRKSGPHRRRRDRSAKHPQRRAGPLGPRRIRAQKEDRG